MERGFADGRSFDCNTASLMSISLPLSRYRFTFRVTAPLEMPSQPGVLWHSVFGKSLKQRACVSPDTECGQCFYLHNCDYPQLFRGVRPPDSEIMRKYSTIPPPHVFISDADHRSHYDTDDLLSVSLVLCGSSNEKFASVATALILAANMGLGKKRVRLKLEGIQQGLPNGKQQELLRDNVFQAIFPAEMIEPSIPPEMVNLQFLTPYRPSGNAGKTHNLEVNRLLMAIIRKVDLIQYFSTGVKLQDDFRFLKALAEALPVLSKNVTYQADERYSAKVGGTKQSGGFIGDISLDLRGSEALWPFLEAGQWLNVGKNASMGYGNYCLKT